MLFWFIFFLIQAVGFIATVLSYSFSFPLNPGELVKLAFIPILNNMWNDLTLFGKIFFLLLDIVFLPAHLFIFLLLVAIEGVSRLFVKG